MAVGVTDGSNALPGQIGEVLSATQSTNQAMTTATALNITTLALTAGDWSVEGFVTMTPSANYTVATAALSTTSATVPASPVGGKISLPVTTGTGLAVTLPTGRVRVSTSAPSTLYLVAQATFASGTSNGTGYVLARRMR